MKLEFKFIKLVKCPRVTKNSKPAVRCGLCIYSVGYEENKMEFSCEAHLKVSDRIYTMNRSSPEQRKAWCSSFEKDLTKWKQL